jgi:hypothetical protein
MPVRTSIMFYIDNIVEYLNSIPHNYPIITSEMPIQQEPCRLYNTEQMTRKGELAKLLARATQSDVVEIWDYSLANIEILKENGICLEPKWVPICAAPTHSARLTEYLKAPKLYDVGFCGTISKRRLQILQELHNRKLRVLIINRCCGDDRDKQLAQCRLLINIHFADDYRVFESARCAQWLDLKEEGAPPVISEESLDDDPRTITVPYNALVDTVIRELSTPSV